MRLDNWISFKMDPNQAASIAALKPALERLIDRAAQAPEQCLEPDPIQINASIFE